MADAAVAEGARYWAFISYSHEDEAFGRRLHRRLEAYALPRRLVGRAIAQGVVPRRLTPIFRDRDELPASTDLSAEVRAALQASRSLIVVCSPAAAASLWVSREVELFRALHPARPVLAALVDGEPGTAFPKALQQVGFDGVPVEPLAGDFRKTGDGKSLGLLKLIAGVLGIGLNELVQRDAQRRLQRVTAVAAAALVAIVVMGALTAFAFNARREAELQHASAEGLAGFMQLDLRDRLRAVGRLDIMAAVNQRALAYYNDEISDLSPKSQGQRALVLLAMAEDLENAGQHDAAKKKVAQARAATAELLAGAPDDPERLFDHAQSEYWMGYMAFAESDFSTARAFFSRYDQLADRMLAVAPDNPLALREKGYAQGNLCTLDLQKPADPKAAVTACKTSLTYLKAASLARTPPTNIGADIENRYAWLADAELAAGDRPGSVALRYAQEKLLTALIQKEPRNTEFRSEWVALQRFLGWIEADSGKQDAAVNRIQAAIPAIDAMIQLDPSNQYWKKQRRKLDADLKQFSGET